MLRMITSGSINITSVIVYIISSLVVVFLTLPVHEFAHAFAADKLGDRTAYYQGRKTLNPLAHIDYMGALFIILFGFGWAKPVPVNARNFQNSKRDMAITAFAGPLANLVMAFIVLLLYNFCIFIMYKGALYDWLYYVALFFLYLAQINVGLAVFNLIPIPPFDGSRIIGAFLSDKIYYRLMELERYSFIFIAFLLFSNVLDKPVDFAITGIMNAFINITALPFGL